ncbi:MAG: nucleotide-binding protein, partial [Candidatus Poribacteria bacterium]|nr:nucleotide-binding protein [Candidatus Poribacteria bacterium]
MYDEEKDDMNHESDNLKQIFAGKYIQIAGSAHETTDLKILKYSHELIRHLTSELLRNCAKLIVATGSEDMADSNKPSWDTGLYYDWNVLETIGDYINSRNSNNLRIGEPLAIIVSSEKSESQIPNKRRDLWNQLIEKQAIHLVRVPPGWNAGAYRRDREAEYGAGLIIVGGGEGVEHSSQLYVKNGKPVIPIDLPITPRYGDGKGGAPEISRFALSNPSEYLGPVDNGTTRLAHISAQNGCASIEQIGPRILHLLADALAISERKKMEETEKDPRRVFVVHGRNEELRRAMFTFLRSIGLEPIEWNEAVQWTESGSPHVDEILNVAFNRAQAIVVLMTPDDEAKLRYEFQSENDPPHEKDLTPQARANVIFEAGMALGRDPNRTVLVEIGRLRPFSDIAGRHTIRLDNSTEKRQALAMRLQTAGCPVNLDGIDWH